MLGKERPREKLSKIPTLGEWVYEDMTINK